MTMWKRWPQTMSKHIALDAVIEIRQDTKSPWVDISRFVTGFSFDGLIGELYKWTFDFIFDHEAIDISEATSWDETGKYRLVNGSVFIDGVDMRDHTEKYVITCEAASVEKISFTFYCDDDVLRFNKTAPWMLP